VSRIELRIGQKYIPSAKVRLQWGRKKARK
jgi:hypothetical protein